MALFVAVLLTLILLGTPLLYLWRQYSPSSGSVVSNKSVAIIVLGDIGRSPRMLYHAQSFCSNGYKTYIVAYAGSKPPEALLNSPNIRFVYLPTPLSFVSGLPRLLFLALAPLKVLLAAIYLLWALVVRLEQAPSFFLVQNPPAIPTLPVVKFASMLLGSKVIIDWHNTGYSVLALRLGSHHPVVEVARWIETFWGRRAYAHLCVTEAMRKNLSADANLSGKTRVFHDRPPDHFHMQTTQKRLELIQRLPCLKLLNPSTPSGNSFVTPDEDPPPVLIVSATSWTADEDFTILLQALTLYEAAARSRSESPGRTPLPNALVVITGKGALKAAFEDKVKILEGGEDGWKWIRVRTTWLLIEDYPKLLGCADLGISLHASTSGADLPMKVVDMFGCGLPVCALDFKCIDELVLDGVNGRVFKNAEDLADQLVTLLEKSSSQVTELARLRDGIKNAKYGTLKEPWGTWQENWDRVVAPLVAV